MCKFNHRLFALLSTFCVFNVTVRPAPLRQNNGFVDIIGDLLGQQTDYDITYHYDQRQKGKENWRFSMDSVFIGVPVEERSDLFIFTDELLDAIGGEELLFGIGKTRPTTPKPNGLNYEILPASSQAYGSNTRQPESEPESESKLSQEKSLNGYE